MNWKDLGERVEVPPIEECGPAMRALNENQRRYVCALGVFGNHQTWAYQWAYDQSDPNSAKVGASRLGSQEKIKRAIDEHYDDKRLRLLPALATERLLEALGPTNLDMKLAMKAVELAADMIPGFKQAIKHELSVTHKMSLSELEEKAKRLTQQLGLPQLPAPDVVDAEYEEVDPDLADIL